MATSHRFTTTIARSGSRTYLVIPFDPNATWGVKPRHYVTGSINGYPVRGALGADGEHVHSPAALDSALSRAFRSDRPFCLNVEIASIPSPAAPAG